MCHIQCAHRTKCKKHKINFNLIMIFWLQPAISPVNNWQMQPFMDAHLEWVDDFAKSRRWCRCIYNWNWMECTIAWFSYWIWCLKFLCDGRCNHTGRGDHHRTWTVRYGWIDCISFRFSHIWHHISLNSVSCTSNSRKLPKCQTCKRIYANHTKKNEHKQQQQNTHKTQRKKSQKIREQN